MSRLIKYKENKIRINQLILVIVTVLIFTLTYFEKIEYKTNAVLFSILFLIIILAQKNDFIHSCNLIKSNFFEYRNLYNYSIIDSQKKNYYVQKLNIFKEFNEILGYLSFAITLIFLILTVAFKIPEQTFFVYIPVFVVAILLVLRAIICVLRFYILLPRAVFYIIIVLLGLLTTAIVYDYFIYIIPIIYIKYVVYNVVIFILSLLMMLFTPVYIVHKINKVSTIFIVFLAIVTPFGRVIILEKIDNLFNKNSEEENVSTLKQNNDLSAELEKIIKDNPTFIEEIEELITTVVIRNEYEKIAFIEYNFLMTFIITNLVMNFKINKCKKKADFIWRKMLLSDEYMTYDNALKCAYYGGEEYESILLNNEKIREQIFKYEKPEINEFIEEKNTIIFKLKKFFKTLILFIKYVNL